MEKYYFSIMGNENDGWWMIEHYSLLTQEELENCTRICNGEIYELIPFSKFNEKRKKYPKVKLCKSVLNSFIKEEDKYLINIIEDVINDDENFLIF